MSCDFCFPIKPGFLNVPPPPLKLTRSAFIETLFIIFYRFFSFIRLQILIIIIIIIIIIVAIVRVFVIIINASNFYCSNFNQYALYLCINQILLNF